MKISTSVCVLHVDAGKSAAQKTVGLAVQHSSLGSWDGGTLSLSLNLQLSCSSSSPDCLHPQSTVAQGGSHITSQRVLNLYMAFGDPTQVLMPVQQGTLPAEPSPSYSTSFNNVTT